MRIKETASETTDTIRQDENLHFKNEECIIFFIYLLTEENLYLKSYHSGLKIGINAFIWVGAYTRSNISAEDKVGLSGGGGGGGLIGREIQYIE